MKILIVNFDSLGDVVFSSYIAHFLSQRMPEAQVDVFSSTYGQQVAEYYPGIHRVHHLFLPWRLTFNGRRGSYFGFFRYLARLRRTHYDIMFCASPHWKDVLAARMVRAEKYVGFVKRPFVARVLTHPCSFPEKPVRPLD